MIRLVIVSFIGFLAFAGFVPQAHAQSNSVKTYSYHPDDIVGVWTNSDNIMKVKIEKIGSHYFGKIIWLEKPLEPDGSPKLDKYNPNPDLRMVPFIGLRVLKDMQYKGEGIYTGGTIYDPEKGKTYGCKITLVSPGEANIRGFIGVALLGKTERFSKVG